MKKSKLIPKNRYFYKTLALDPKNHFSKARELMKVEIREVIFVKLETPVEANFILGKSLDCLIKTPGTSQKRYIESSRLFETYEEAEASELIEN